MRLPEFFQWTPEERRAVLAILLFTGGGGLLLELGRRFPQWTPDLRTARALVAADSAGGGAPDSARPHPPAGGADSSRAPLSVAALSGGAVNDTDRPADDDGQGGGPARSGSRPTGPVDLNRADAHRLADLPGVGPALAARIVDYRREHGPFRSPDDLDKVKGVGPALLQRIAGLVVMGAAEDSTSSPP
jgi:competence protein ComEA